MSVGFSLQPVSKDFTETEDDNLMNRLFDIEINLFGNQFENNLDVVFFSRRKPGRRLRRKKVEIAANTKGLVRKCKFKNL